jgi:predicted acetyltransferase
MVGLLPSHRRRGIFKRLMRELLSDAHERSEPIAVLWAAEGGIYPQFGFGLGSKNARIDIEAAKVVFREQFEPVGRLRMIGLDDARTVLPPTYDRVRVSTPGMLARSPEWWDAYRLGDPEHERGGGGPLHCCVVAVGVRDEAYALYRFHPQYEHRLHHDWLDVVEAMGTSPAATREIWRCLLSMDLVERVRAEYVPEDHPLMLMLAEPGRLRHTLCDGLWLRLVDVETALRARSYACAGSIVLEVADADYDWNAGCWRIEAGPDGVHVERSIASPDLRLDVDDLATVYLGAFTFMDLLHAGRVEESSEGAALRASLLFQRSRAPWCAEVI